MRKSFLVCIASIIFSGCLGQVKNDTLTQVQTGITKNTAVHLRFSDSSILKSDIVKAFTYTDSIWGHPVFCDKIQTNIILHSSTFLVQSNEVQTLYFVQPGEEIKIKMGTDKSLILYIEGNEQRTNELNFFRILIQKFGQIYNLFPKQSYLKKASSIDSLLFSEKIINEIKNKRLNFLDSFDTKNLISKYFSDIARYTIQSAAIKDSLMLFLTNKDLLIKRNLYKQFVMEKITTIKHIPFQPFLLYLKTCEGIANMASVKYLNYDLKDSIDLCYRFHFIDSNFIGITKDFLLAKAFFTAYYKQIPVSKDLLAKFYIECSDSGYKKIIAEKANEKERFVYPKGSNNLMYSDEKNIKSLKFIIENYKGKVVFIDFWASWCAPCRKELPFSHELSKEYSKKSIAFIYISTDENILDWKNAVVNENLDKNDNFLFLNSATSSFMLLNNIATIPRYMLIDKDGNIISSDAPRPSDPKLKSLIDKYLQ